MAHPAAFSGLLTVPRRRRSADTPMERATVTLRADVLAAAKALSGNLSAFVEEAVEEKLRRSRREALYAAYDAAASNRAFMEDMHSVSEAFASTDSDGLKG